MCDARIRPMRPHEELEVCCELVHTTVAEMHSGTIKLGAWPTLTWMEDDRRNYHGNWPGACPLTIPENLARTMSDPPPGAPCILPAGHRGRCTA